MAKNTKKNAEGTTQTAKAPRAPRVVPGSITIETDVALPAARASYPFEAMPVGGSFVVPTGKEQSCRAAMSKASKRLNFNLTIRKTESGALRCFRLADVSEPAKSA